MSVYKEIELYDVFISQSLTSDGLISANLGITLANSNTLNVGTSGLISILNIYGETNAYGSAAFTGSGHTLSDLSTLYVNPISTTVLGSSNYYFTHLAQPITTGTTSGSAYTLYIENAPSGSITNSYAAYISSGKTYIGGSLQIPTGATNGYILTSDSSGNSTWSPGLDTTGFTNGSAAAPSIFFANDTSLNTGFYRIGENNIGITTNGIKCVDIGTSTISISNGITLNIGTSGTTSPLNAFGLITGTNGLTISAGSSSLQAITAAGLINANLGITIANGQPVNVGTSGITSTLNIFGTSNCSGSAEFTGLGNTTASNSTLYVAPVSTVVSGALNYYFTHLAQPTTSGTTTGSAYTMYIAGAPTGTITNPYAAYIAAGKTYIGGALQIPTGGTNKYVLTSDATGNATWITPTVENFTAQDSTSRTTTSTTAVNMINMTLTPTTGTYYIIFQGIFKVGTGNRTMNVQLAKNGTSITGTLTSSLIASNSEIPIFTSDIVTCNGTDVITVQWFITGGAATMTASNQKYMTAMRLGA